MRVEKFFEKFEQFAEAPNAVAKMRELVLSFAIQGKLALQDPSDEPAVRVLELFGMASKRAMRTRSTDEVNDESTAQLEPLFGLPDGWEWIPFRRLPIQASVGIDRGRSMQGPEKAFAYFKMNNIRNSGGIDLSDLTRIDAAPDEIESFALADGDFLFNTRNSRELVGKTCVFRPPSEEPVLYNNNILRVKFIDGFSSDFLDYWFRSPEGKSGLEKLKSNTTNVCAIYQGKLSGFPCPIPPLAEQKRIVAKVDELMALCDQLEAQQQERASRHAALARASLTCFADAPTPANLNLLFHPSYAVAPADLRKAILSLAVQGKLVPQNSNDESAGQLRELIEKHRATLFGSESLRRTKPCRQFATDEAPYAIPDTWVWTMLGEITDIGTGSTPSRTEASFWTSGSIPWITSGSTSSSPITEGNEFVTAEAVKAHRLRIYPPSTLLVALYGQGKTRGQVAVLKIAATINQACAAVCSLKGIAPMQGYLKLLLEKQYDEMRSLAAGGAQPNLNVQKIKELFVPLPPLAEQLRIVTKVDQLMALVDQLEAQLATSRATAINLMEAVVAELTTAQVDAASCIPAGSSIR